MILEGDGFDLAEFFHLVNDQGDDGEIKSSGRGIEMEGQLKFLLEVKMELEFIQVNLYGIFNHFAAVQIHWKILYLEWLGGIKKNYDGSNGEVYGGILIFLEKHVNRQGFVHPRRNHERKKLEGAQAIGSRGTLSPLRAFLKIS
jgi:hypothetical protein